MPMANMDMEISEKKKFTELMSRFSSNEHISENNLRKYHKEVIQEAVDKGYLKIKGQNNIGVNQYVITEKGKQFW